MSGRDIRIEDRSAMKGNSRFTIDDDEVRVKVNGSQPRPMLRAMALHLDELIDYPRTLRGVVTDGEEGRVNLHLKTNNQVKVVSFRFDAEGDLIARHVH